MLQAPGNCGLLGGGGTLAEVGWDGVLSDGGTSPDGGVDQESCLQRCSCAPATNRCDLVQPGLLACRQFCVGGRAPPGAFALSGVDASPGSWLARMAELEGAAVDAFVHLSEELEVHRLPELAAAAMAAAQDEVRHAAQVTRLALRQGRCPVHRRGGGSHLRSLEAMAIDNASEGCGRELFGAVINAHQARTASDPQVARVMGEIAADELSHARLSFSLAEVLMPRLTLAQRRRAREAQEQTLSALGSDGVPEAMRQTLGLMDDRQSRATARSLLEQARL